MLTTVRSTVAEEVAFGLENRGMARLDMVREVGRIAELTGLDALLGRNPASLSGGQLRRLAIACAVVTDPDVLVLDEPLASLDAAGVIQVRDLIRRLTGAGTAVVVLSQAADGLARSAAHWLVLDGGTATAGGPPRGLIRSAELARTGTVIHAVTHTAPARTVIQTPVIQAPVIQAQAAVRDPGHQLEPGRAPESQPANEHEPESQPKPPSVPALELNSVGFSFPPGRGAVGEPVLRNLCLAVRPGDIVAVTGRNGAGKSTLLRHLNGLLRPDTGEVRVSGTSIAGLPAGRVAALVGLLFQHPRDQLFERTVLREVGFGLRRLFGKEAGARAQAALAAVGLSADAETHPAELPASKQRLLALATVLAREPAVLVLDEPTVGLDRHGLEFLHRAVEDSAARGAAVVLVTHDLSYARATAHRVLVLDGGSLREI